MKKTVLKIIIFSIFIFIPALYISASAQPGPPANEPIPIDGGLTFLIIAGATYGASRIYKDQKKENL
jgi:hypothetical protein